MNLLRIAGLVAAIAGAVSPAMSAEIVEFRTSLGTFEVALYPEAAPDTVANFLRYVDDDAYADSIVHRSVTDFVIQGGGYTYTESNGLDPVATHPPIAREDSGLSNVRGSLAMARNNSLPNSATSQRFINTVDNVFLDTDGGGWTVFGSVLGDGIDIVDAIASLPTVDASPSLQDFPYRGSIQGALGAANMVYVNVVRVPEPSTGVIGIACLLGLGSIRFRRMN